MARKILFRWFVPSAAFAFCISTFAQTISETRTNIQTVNTDRSFPVIESKAAWENRAKEIREQILVSCGLWPMPEKAPLKTQIFGKVARDGYTIEKVYFQTYPGFYLAGNLYRPLGKGSGPFPAVLNPHGHWENGRMADFPEGSIAARCINFAKQGMVAFSYDMVGYNDTFFPDHGAVVAKNFYTRHRRFATNESNMLWNISLMGLQTWNSIRALDFLQSLPDVDKTRLACTGESGGGTQTYILGAIDDRLAAQAPVVMVSHTMQGGCSCENVSGLRINYSNVEITAVPAPRPQIIVGATGDWTRDTLKMEGPSVESIYRFFEATNKFRHVMFVFKHNYNQTSREAVYDFFGTWLRPAAPASREAAYEKEFEADLRVFPDNKLPADALPEQEVIAALVETYRSQLARLKPTDKKSLQKYKDTLLPAWRHTLQVAIPKDNLWSETVYLRTMTNYTSEKLFIGRKDKGDKLPALHFSPEGSKKITVILAHPKGKSAFLDKDNEPIGLAKLLLEKKVSVLLLDTFLTGDLANPELSNVRAQQVEMFFATYNRTDMQERVQDLITATAYVKKKRRHTAMICGTDRAGLWALLAAPAADGIIADCSGLDSSSDAEMLKPDMFVPGLRKIGGFEGVAALAAGDPVLLHNTGQKFQTSLLKDASSALKAKSATFENAAMSDAGISEWIAELR